MGYVQSGVRRVRRRVTSFGARLVPGRVRIGATERWRVFVGAAFGILVTALVSRWLADGAAPAYWLAAPLGASAVLVFAVPASPLAQPWAVIGGNTLSALVGITCALYIGDPVWAGAAAVGLSIAVMFALRCLHPPGGATALLAVLGHATSFQFAVFPMLTNSVLLVLVGMFYNSLTGRRYPHGQVAKKTATTAPPGRFSSADLDAAMAHYNQVLDVSRDDLEELLHFAELAAFQRTLGTLRCADIMSREPLSVAMGTPLDEAWGLMRQRRIKALPVVDVTRRIVGIVTVADFMRQADLDVHEGLGGRLRALMRGAAAGAAKPTTVGQLMTRKVRVASEQSHVIELVPLFSEGGHHHIPIIDAEQRLTGILTQSDLVRALYRAVKLTD